MSGYGQGGQGQADGVGKEYKRGPDNQSAAGAMLSLHHVGVDVTGTNRLPGVIPQVHAAYTHVQRAQANLNAVRGAANDGQQKHGDPAHHFTQQPSAWDQASLGQTSNACPYHGAQYQSNCSYCVNTQKPPGTPYQPSSASQSLQGGPTRAHPSGTYPASAYQNQPPAAASPQAVYNYTTKKYEYPPQ